MSSYEELKNRQQKEFNEFPIYFAFGDKQFKELLEKLNLSEDEEADNYYVKRLTAIGAGGVILKEDKPKYVEMVARHSQEHFEAIEADKDGTGYIYEMFLYELRNHEYGYTHNPEPAFTACGLTRDSVVNNEIMNRAFCKAVETINKEGEEND